MRRIIAFLNIATMFMQYPAMAQSQPGPLTHQKVKDWTYERGNFDGLPQELCWAHTQKKADGMEWTLKVAHDPVKLSPDFLLISSNRSEGLPMQVTARGNSTQIQYNFLRAPQWDNAQTFGYWFVPVQGSNLYKQLRRDSSLRADFKIGDKVKTIYFSLSGSMKTFDLISKHCNQGKEFFASEFFDYLDKVPAPTKDFVLVAEPQKLQEHVARAWTAYIASGTTASALKLIEQQIKPLLEQETRYLERTGKLDIAVKEKSALKAELEASVVELQKTKVAAEKERSKTEAQLEPALAVLKKKEEQYAPLAEKAKPFLKDIEVANRAAQTSQADLTSSTSSLQQARSASSAAGSEYQQCKRDFDSIDTTDADRKVDAAELDYRRNEYSTQIDRALNEDSQLAFLRNQLRQAENQESDALREVGNQERVVSNLEANLSNCQQRCQISPIAMLETPFFVAMMEKSNAADRCKPGDVFCGGECHSSRDRCPGENGRGRDRENEGRDRIERERRERERGDRDRNERERREREGRDRGDRERGERERRERQEREERAERERGERERREREERERGEHDRGEHDRQERERREREEHERNERDRQERERRERERQEQERRERQEREERERERRQRCEANCSNIGSQLSVARSQLQSLELRLSNRRSEVSSIESQIQQRRSQVDSGVRSTSEHYFAILQAAKRNLRELENRKNAAEECMNSASSDYARAQDNIRSLEPRVASATAQVQRDQDALKEATARFKTFAESSGYTRAKQEFEQASVAVSNLRTILLNLDKTIQEAASAIARNSASIQKLKLEIDDLVAQVAQNTGELAQIEALLKPLREQRDNLAGELQATQATLLKEAQSFKALLQDATQLLKLQFRTQSLNFYPWDSP